MSNKTENQSGPAQAPSATETPIAGGTSPGTVGTVGAGSTPPVTPPAPPAEKPKDDKLKKASAEQHPDLAGASFRVGDKVALDLGVATKKPIEAEVSGVYHDSDGWSYELGIHTADAVAIRGLKARKVYLTVPADVVQERAGSKEAKAK